MTYVEGFVTAVPTANKQAYIDHANRAAPLLREFGAIRLAENWSDDVPDGKINDFKVAVLAKEDETVLLSWIEYPDRATRDGAIERMMTDPRMKDFAADMPFDASRMIFGGFTVEVDDGASADTRYVDGFVLPVPPDRKDAYFDIARRASAVFRDHGATRVVEAWGDDVPLGKVTDFATAAHARDDEVVVYAWVEWPSKQVRDTGMAAVAADDRMQTPPADMPFDGQRMIYGGFATILDA
ncbi:DUF1428 domain-containing protein [Sphingomonas sp. BT553]|uniref:DUF1428 domain-containing protein n=1 Tax=Sphingomonas mollis TaxID=2795726 RepID=A0ABS0XT60_9SPHN|nr:DUF1428 domain-containing protein [Sphingomonas sp. BT553]